MKKLISLALALVMMLAVAIPAFAVDYPATSGTTNIEYIVEAAYTVTIPATAEIDKEFAIEATDVNVVTSLKVSIDEWSNSSGTFGLTGETNNDFMPCTVTIGDASITENAPGTAYTTLDTAFLTVEDPEGNVAGTGKKYIKITRADTAIYTPDKYKGNLIFGISHT